MKLSIENKARLVFAASVLLAAAASFAWYLASARRYATYEVRTQDAVSGLIADAPVELHGVEVGKVTHVALTDAHSVSILLKVQKDAPVTNGTVATITARGLATRGFTGYVYVSLEDTGSDPRPVAAGPGEPYPRLRTAPSRSANLDTAIAQLNQNVQAMSDRLQSVLDERTVASLKQSAANAEQASRELKPLLRSTGDSVRALQTQVLPQAYQTLARMNQLSASLNAAAGKVNRDPSVLVRGAAAPRPGPGEAQ